MNKKNQMFTSNSVKPNNVKRIKRVTLKRDPRDVKNYNILRSLRGRFEDSLNVTFKLLGGGIKVIPLNNSFFINDNNKKLNEALILEKLNTLKHDFGADQYIINKF